jgi:hypothetical protein
MPILPLNGDMRVQFEAIDPSTGAAVTGVKVSLAVIYATDKQGVVDGGNTGPFMLVPGPESIA